MPVILLRALQLNVIIISGEREKERSKWKQWSAKIGVPTKQPVLNCLISINFSANALDECDFNIDGFNKWGSTVLHINSFRGGQPSRGCT